VFRNSGTITKVSEAQDMKNYTVNHLRVLCEAYNLDISQCGTKDENLNVLFSMRFVRDPDMQTSASQYDSYATQGYADVSQPVRQLRNAR
jgi:hypothetical protein